MRISDWSSDVCSSDQQAKSHRIGEIVDVRGTRRRGVKHAGAWQMVLEENAANALLRAFLRPESALAARDTAHFVSFVKADHAFEIIARPIYDLLHSARSYASRVGTECGMICIFLCLPS